MVATDKLHIGTNTKMYKNITMTTDFLSRLGELTSGISRERMELFVIPSFTTLSAASGIAEKGDIRLGAQNMGWEDEGQFTGEISPLMLKEVGVGIIEIGHSERRHVLGETDVMENRKVLCALRHGFNPLLCVGETGEQKEAGLADEVLRMQLKLGLRGVEPEEAKALRIAYEPVWAIGVSGVPASKEYAEERHRTLRQCLVELFGAEAGGGVPLLYGGSVNNENAPDLIRMPSIDGLFIGRAAWDAENFMRILTDVLPLFEVKRANERMQPS